MKKIILLVIALMPLFFTDATVAQVPVSFHLEGSGPGARQAATQQFTTVNGVQDATTVGLAAAVSACGLTNCTVQVRSALSLSDSLSIPKNVGLQILAGGSINVPSGKSLTVAAPIYAGIYQIFTGTGNVFFYGGVSAEKVYPQWFGAMGNAKASGFTCTAGNAAITIANAAGAGAWVAGDSITLTGAGPSGKNYTTTVVSFTGSSMVVATAPSTTVSTLSPAYNVDDSAALNRWASSIRGTSYVGQFPNATAGYQMTANLGPGTLYVPKGQYNVCSAPVVIYSGAVVTFEAANTSHSAVFVQCNVNIPVIQVNPNNFDPAGNMTTSGEGVNTFNNVNIRGSYIIGNLDTPAIQFLNARNVVSDTHLNNLMCESIAGTCIVVGFRTSTSGTVSAGSTSIPVLKGSTLVNGTPIQIVGAGAGGTTLNATVVSGGGTNSLVISPATSTTVSNAIVQPATDFYGLIVNNPEVDFAGSHFFESKYNASGTIWIDNGEIFNPIYGAVFLNSSNVSLRWTNNKCFGCGQPRGVTDLKSHAIYTIDNSGSKTADIVIENSAFYPLSGPLGGNTFGGNIQVQNARSLDIHDSQLWDVDNSGNNKGIVTIANSLVNITGNTVSMSTFSSSAANSSLVEFCCNASDAAEEAVVTGNNFYNSNASKRLAQGIHFDVAPILGRFALNNYAGIASPSNSGAASTVMQRVGSFTMTNATSDTFTGASTGAMENIRMLGIGSECMAQPENSTAAAISSSVFIAPVIATGVVTVHHTATGAAGAQFLITCSAN